MLHARCLAVFADSDQATELAELPQPPLSEQIKIIQKREQEQRREQEEAAKEKEWEQQQHHTDYSYYHDIKKVALSETSWWSVEELFSRVDTFWQSFEELLADADDGTVDHLKL